MILLLVKAEEEDKQYAQEDEEEHSHEIGGEETVQCLRTFLGLRHLPGTKQVPWQTLLGSRAQRCLPVKLASKSTPAPERLE